MQIPGWIQFVGLIEWALQSINQAVGNPGLAIIIFTLFIKLLTLPLTLKSFRSTKEMQRIQPLVKEINKRYKDDKAKIQAETMRVYQEHGVNPMGGCLPMIIQLPIFFALYQALSQLIGFNGNHGIDASFQHAFLWVPNLAQKDPYYIWPVLSGVFQFITQRMSQPYGYTKTADSQQVMMSRIMQFTPVYLMVIYVNFAAGAVIYWTFSGIFTAMQTYFVNGFGSLSEVPGLTWLPRRPLAPPTPQIQEEIAEVDAEADGKQKSRRTTASNGTIPSRGTALPPASSSSTGRPVAKGFMAKMLEQAQAAAEAQEAARRASDEARQAAESNGNGAHDGVDAEEIYPPVTAAGRTGAANGRDGKGAPRPGASANGIEGAGDLGDLPTGSSLPRKRRSKR